jgi:hypothetical protein
MPFSAIPPDTDAAAHEVQRDILRRLGGRERVEIMFRLNEAARRMAMAGIRTRHPEYDDEMVTRAYTRLVLGDELVRAVWPGRDLVAP